LSIVSRCQRGHKITASGGFRRVCLMIPGNGEHPTEPKIMRHRKSKRRPTSDQMGTDNAVGNSSAVRAGLRMPRPSGDHAVRPGNRGIAHVPRDGPNVLSGSEVFRSSRVWTARTVVGPSGSVRSPTRPCSLTMIDSGYLARSRSIAGIGATVSNRCFGAFRAIRLRAC